jgi:thioredoxin-related protein
MNGKMLAATKRSRNFYCRLLMLVFLWLPVAMSVSASISLFDISLRLLSHHPQASLQQNKPQLLMFYQPDCRWCGLQMQAMQVAQPACEEVVMQLVGIRGSERQLRAELRRHRSDLPAFFGSEIFVRQVGGVAATPMTLLLNAKGEEVRRYRGYLNEEQLLAAANWLTANACTEMQK